MQGNLTDLFQVIKQYDSAPSLSNINSLVPDDIPNLEPMYFHFSRMESTPMLLQIG